MATDPRLQELLSRWHDLQQKGQAPAPEELCADCPELAGELRRRLQAVASLEGFLDRLEPARLTRQLVKRLEALGHKVTLEAPPAA